MAEQQITAEGTPTVQSVDRKADTLLNIMIGVVVVLLIGFITLLVMVTQMTMDTYHNKQTDYQRLTDQIQAQNDQLNDIQRQLAPNDK